MCTCPGFLAENARSGGRGMPDPDRGEGLCNLWEPGTRRPAARRTEIFAEFKTGQHYFSVFHHHKTRKNFLNLHETRAFIDEI